MITILTVHTLEDTEVIEQIDMIELTTKVWNTQKRKYYPGFG